jgi:3-hydroxyacyl-CoA dehydrogenase
MRGIVRGNSEGWALCHGSLEPHTIRREVSVAEAESSVVGIVGGGVMGAGIAMSFAQAGYEVIVRDLSDESLARTRHAMRHGRFGWDRAVQLGKFTQVETEEFAGRMTYTVDLAPLASAGLIVEAIPEYVDLKRELFAELDEVAAEDAIFATNTSGFSIGDLAMAVARRDRFLGMHWFSPANVMRLVELIYTPQTSEETLTRVEEICASLGKTSIRVKDAPGAYGFVANRVAYAAMAEAQKIVEAGIATPEDIDTAMKLGYNWAAGPFEVLKGRQTGWG